MDKTTPRTRTPGGRILRLAYSIERGPGGKWRVTGGYGKPGGMSILAARAECKRRNRG